MKSRRLFNCLVSVFIGLVTLVAIVVPSYASDTNDYGSYDLKKDDLEEIEDIYEKLFPEYYHYIEEYVAGNNYSDSRKSTIFEGSKEYNGKTYYLDIFIDGSYLWYIVEDVPVSNSSIKGSDEYFHKNVSVSIPELSGYVYFSVDYYINTSGYDGFVSTSCSGGNGVLYYPWNMVYKQCEDSNGNAYYGYNYCFSNVITSAYFFDVGLSLGGDRMGVVLQNSSVGLGSFLNYLLYGFVNRWV